MFEPVDPAMGSRRLGIIFAVLAAGVGAFSVVLLVALIGETTCDSTAKWGCIGWLFVGIVAGSAVALIVVLLLGRRLGLGWAFGLVMIGVTALALLPLEEWMSIAFVALAPVAAGALTWPRSVPQGADPTTSSVPVRAAASRRWGLLPASLGLLVATVGGYVVWNELSMAASRTAAYETSGIPVFGLPDGAEWRGDPGEYDAPREFRLTTTRYMHNSPKKEGALR